MSFLFIGLSMIMIINFLFPAEPVERREPFERERARSPEKSVTTGFVRDKFQLDIAANVTLDLSIYTFMLLQERRSPSTYLPIKQSPDSFVSGDSQLTAQTNGPTCSPSPLS